MAEFILERSTIDPKVFKRNKAKDWYFSSEEQVKYGLADRIIKSLDEII